MILTHPNTSKEQNAARYYDKNKALARFHAACNAKGLKDYQKAAILEAYGVESSKDLTITQLLEAAATIQPRDTQSGDYWRKCVIACIGGWLRKQPNEKFKQQCNNLLYIMSIAITAACIEILGSDKTAINKAFNSIEKEKLKAIYNDFKDKQKGFI